MASALPDAVRHHEANCQYGQNAAPAGPGRPRYCVVIRAVLQGGFLTRPPPTPARRGVGPGVGKQRYAPQESKTICT